VCVCIYVCWLVRFFGPTTYRKFQMTAFKYFTKIDIACSMRVKASGGLLSECSIIGNPERKLKRGRQLVYALFVCVNKPSQLRTMTGKLHRRLLTDGRYTRWLRLLQVLTTLRPEIQLTICLVHACVAIVAALTDSGQS